jgi:hypothetical protein
MMPTGNSLFFRFFLIEKVQPHRMLQPVRARINIINGWLEVGKGSLTVPGIAICNRKQLQSKSDREGPGGAAFVSLRLSNFSPEVSTIFLPKISIL